METFVEIYKYICCKLFNDESNLKKEARLSEEEVAETARRYAASIGWTNNFHQNPPHIHYKKEKFVWNVFFSPTKDELPIRGGCLRIYIDDETGEVIKKLVGTR